VLALALALTHGWWTSKHDQRAEELQGRKYLFWYDPITYTSPYCCCMNLESNGGIVELEKKGLGMLTAIAKQERDQKRKGFPVSLPTVVCGVMTSL